MMSSSIALGYRLYFLTTYTLKYALPYCKLFCFYVSHIRVRESFFFEITYVGSVYYLQISFQGEK